MRFWRKSATVGIAAQLILFSSLFFFDALHVSAQNETETDGVSTVSSYDDYINAYKGAARPKEEIIILPANIDSEHSKNILLSDTGISTDETSSAVFQFDVSAEGLYSLIISYTTVEGKYSDIQRELLLDGKTVNSSAGTIALNRIFEDDKDGVKTDSRGNEYRPGQKEVIGTYNSIVTDSQGYVKGNLLFFLSKGAHSLSLVSEKEPVIINKITFFNAEKLPSYAEVVKEYSAKGYKNASESSQVILQAENTYLKSSSTLYPINDRTSSITQPSDVSRIKLNTIGGNTWRYPGQWISWQISVKESGLYSLCFRYKQNFTEGQISTRTLFINDEIPFSEAENITFKFSYDWQMKTIGDDIPYLFYFEKGKIYTIKLENSLGEYADILRQAQKSVLALNDIYRQVKMIVGSSADQNRDYSIEKQLPNCIADLKKQQEILKSLAEKTQTLGGKGNGYGSYQRLFVQIANFLKDSDKLPKQLDSFSTNINSLADYVLSASEQPLTIDYILLNPPENKTPQVKDSLFQKLAFEVSSFFVSFVSDYNMVGNEQESNSTIDLWLTTGRDQAGAVKQLIDNDFTKATQIGVNVRLVTADVILPAVAAGKGPDVTVEQEKSLPVRYGLRNSLTDLSEFSDLPEILSRFNSGAYAPFYVGNKLYALPDTQNFLLMYVRNDVLSSLNIELPDTWDKLYTAIYTLQQNNLGIGLPNITEDNLDIFYMLLFQQGGGIFTDDLSKTRLDEQTGIDAFTRWSQLYTKYKLPQEMNQLTRFRTGEAPIVIANISFYNILALSAPEIKGLWQISTVPGRISADGSVNKSVGSTPTGAVIFKDAKNKENCWSFIKWWTSASVQSSYSREMENALGASGRVIAANLEAFNSLSWPSADRKVMNDQRKYIKGIPEIAGSYVLDRYLCTALRLTIQTGGSPREILLDWNKKINIENQIRRKEFGLA